MRHLKISLSRRYRQYRIAGEKMCNIVGVRIGYLDLVILFSTAKDKWKQLLVSSKATKLNHHQEVAPPRDHQAKTFP
jgi:hypothetical protein